MRLRPFKSPMTDKIGVHIIRLDFDARKSFRCSGLEWEKIHGIEMFPPPPVELDESEAQELMDMLWQCGVRPTEGAGTAGSMRAVENHLKDMQRIAFDLLGRGRR